MNPVLGHRIFSELSPSSSEILRIRLLEQNLGFVIAYHPHAAVRKFNDILSEICQGKQHNRIVAECDLLRTSLCWRHDEVDQCNKYLTATARKYLESRKRFTLIFLYPSYAPPACLRGVRLLGQGHQLSPQSDRVSMIVSAADYAPDACQ
jgi:hypothetical protein